MGRHDQNLETNAGETVDLVQLGTNFQIEGGQVSFALGERHNARLGLRGGPDAPHRARLYEVGNVLKGSRHPQGSPCT